MTYAPCICGTWPTPADARAGRCRTCHHYRPVPLDADRTPVTGRPHVVAMACGVLIILIAAAMAITLLVPAVLAVAIAAFGGILTGMAVALWAEGAP